MIESEVIKTDLFKEANSITHLMALENAQSYEGQNGFLLVEFIMENDENIDKKTA